MAFLVKAHKGYLLFHNKPVKPHIETGKRELYSVPDFGTVLDSENFLDGINSTYTVSNTWIDVLSGDCGEVVTAKIADYLLRGGSVLDVDTLVELEITLKVDVN